MQIFQIERRWHDLHLDVTKGQLFFQARSTQSVSQSVYSIDLFIDGVKSPLKIASAKGETSSLHGLT
ncbi:hypothetical protein XH94_06100 [Bradyrhizobium zhanjiangense]|uniref:Uncharacterized protein n=1 Tax=Bradyrhizobium zhanjiangense TaxID=1325107 RepID=A0A4Q0SUP6_9BRAD|nr:hypothetical protein XH94_06100 [Bradyrhizobium zhanjiangense]